MKRILSIILALTMCISMAATVFAAEMKFTDVKKSDWFYDDVKTAVESGLVNGKSATTYAPNDNLTYAEAIKLAACMHQLYMDGMVTLKNGTANWYDTYVDYCIDNGIIDNYTAFAVIPLSDGHGELSYIGNRAIPLQATSIIARVTDKNSGNTEEIRTEIPQLQKTDSGNCVYRISLLSDLHLSNKTGKIMRALKLASESDCILIAGDLVNDGTAEQLKLLRECVNTAVPNTVPLFSVGGNHDFPIKEEESDFDYWNLQNGFLERNKNFGFNTEIHESGCWSAENDDIHIFGWKCVDENRNFFFGKKKEQLEFLADRLEKNKDKKYQIVCSHAPLIAHNPQRKPEGQRTPKSSTLANERGYKAII